MTSLLTNTSAMTALQTLSLTNKNLATTQNRIATGERVSTASDNAAYWSIATGMKAQNSALGAVKDSLGFGSAVVDTAYTGLNEAIKLTEQILAKTVAMQQGGVDETAVQAEIDTLTAQITAISVAADFEGQNLLSDATPTFEVVSGWTKGGDEVSKLDVAGFDLAVVVTALEAADGDTAVNAVEAQLTLMRGAAAKMGASKASIDSSLDFTSKLMDAIDRGVGVLVDADMNAESARLSALQTQQQLGIQALSIANQNSQSVLSLFR
ncbi:flagellin [Aliihoeflea sp. 2WW]|uniref:flagellin N-terminal helical domain-containing protein n=1 Tax=Aliihoeflea sp. 2WW TaxID=1381123 RepID=UPI0004649936|nr:flagellin [Aliihoeflea sp. 2WW]